MFVKIIVGVPVLEPDEGAAEKDEEAEEDQENNDDDDGENMRKWWWPRWVTSPGIKLPTLRYIAGWCNAGGLKWEVLNDSKRNFALAAS